MEEKNEYELVVLPGNRPLWMRILAALFFTFMLYVLYDYSRLLCYEGWCKHTNDELPEVVKSVSYCLSGGIAFSVIKTVLIDVDKDKLVSRFSVGPFSKDVLSVIPELEYVSVFRDSRGNYEVNLWYVGNKHYNMYCFDEKNPAMKFAQMVSEKLNIDFLDATEKGNSKWIEKPQQ